MVDKGKQFMTNMPYKIYKQAPNHNGNEAM